MLAVAAFVAENPGCCKTEAAHGIGQMNHNYGQGFGPVDRAIRAGLVKAVRVRVNRYALYPPSTQLASPSDPEPAGWQPGHP